MQAIVRATLLGLALSNCLAGTAAADCATATELKSVDAEVGIIQSISQLKVKDTPTGKIHAELLGTSLDALVDALLKNYKTAKVGVAGFSSYDANGDKKTDFCNKEYSPLSGDAKVVDGKIAEMTEDTYFPSDNKDTTDSALGSAMIELSHMGFSASSQGKTFRVLLIQSDKTPYVTPTASSKPFQGDGNDKCSTEAPTLEKVKEMLNEKNVYLTVVAAKSAESEWKKVCSQIGRCSLTSSETIYNTDKKTFLDVLLTSFCKYRDATSTTTTTASTAANSTTSGTHAIAGASTVGAVLLGLVAV